MRARLCAVSLGLLAAAVTLLWVHPGRTDDDVSTAQLGKKIVNLKFKNGSAPATALYNFKDKSAIVLVFLSFDCPVSTSYAEMLRQTADEFGKSGVAFVGLTVNPDEDAAAIAKHAREFKLPFPVYRDDRLVAADAVAAEVTPEVFVLDGDYVLRYRGRIDDTWAARLKKKTRQAPKQDLKQALGELLSGRTLSVPATKSVGCLIPREKPVAARTPYTYHRDVAPILQKNCQTCHRPGEVGPFALMNYKQAVNWAADVKTYTQSKAMPPWKPVAGEPFHNERRLSDREIAVLASWADGGTPEGDPKDAPAAPHYPSGWYLGKPDLVLTVPEDFTVGGSGHDIFRCFVLPTNLTEEKQVVAVEVRAGNPRIVHHTLQYVDVSGQGRKLEAKQRAKDKEEPPEHADSLTADKGPGYTSKMGIGFLPKSGIGGWAPGNLPRFLPEGTYYSLPKNSDIIVQVHYHRNGKVEKDRTQIGLYFAKKKADRLYQGSVIAGRTGDGPLGLMFSVPKGTEDFVLKGSTWAQADCTLFTIMPHMHMIGRKIKITMTPPDGPAKTLLAIDDWDYNWQETYVFKTPVRVKAGTRMEVEAHYDNSVNNPNNPHSPPRTVTYGEQTTDEMCFVFLGGIADQPGGKGLPFRPAPPKREAAREKPAEKKAEAKGVQVPFKLTDSLHIMVRVKIDGKGPLNFIVDTGAPIVFVSKEAAKKIGLAEDKKGWAVLDRLELEGGLRAPKTKARVETIYQLEGMNAMGLAGVELHGVLGYNLLAHYKMEIDFTRAKMTWTPLDFEPPPLVPIGGKGPAGMEALGGMLKFLSAFMGKTLPGPPRPRGFLGLELEDSDGDYVTVKGVLKGGPAAKAGVRTGDHITAFQGKSVSSLTGLQRMAARLTVTGAVRLTVERAGKSRDISFQAGGGL